jgi:hypothetical protein
MPQGVRPPQQDRSAPGRVLRQALTNINEHTPPAPETVLIASCPTMLSLPAHERKAGRLLMW